MGQEQQLGELFPGYKVEKLDESAADNLGWAYKVTGPRSNWKLLRNRPNPQLLFVVGRHGSVGKIRGYEWFTDKDGTLRPVR